MPLTTEAIQDLVQNDAGETRLVAEVNGEVVGIGAVVLPSAELRACYVLPRAARKGCGTALVREIERMARESGLSRLHLVASVNAEPFYASLGYVVRERGEHVLSSGCGMAAVWMEKHL